MIGSSTSGSRLANDQTNAIVRMSIFDRWDWITFGLGAAIVICNFFVWRAVALEESSDEYDKEKGKSMAD